MHDLDQRDRELLSALQSEVPIASTPFAIIGQQLEMSEKEVIKRIARLKLDGTIRHLGASFDGKALGYSSCLVAAHVDPSRIDQAAEVINSHPCVTQNYARNHELNLWFTISVPAHSSLGLQNTLNLLAGEAGLETVLPLPTLRLFKGAESSEGHEERIGGAPPALTAEEIESIRLLQNDLPLQPRPFDTLARMTGVDSMALLQTAKDLHERGLMRKLTASAHSRRSNFSMSIMGVWMVPEDRIEEFGARMAEHRTVSHCYLRPTSPAWPYNVFTTIHGRSVDECESTFETIANENRISEKRALFPVKEYKRARITYLGPELEVWESARADGHEASAVS